ncbi:hypothetical protein IVB14_33775 [Bradyrhizobium sp. 180]|nr:hypothetical protein [Bradyrhizobium sp. 180]MCK1597404.1 hypothetical protein [Bradyrhizobium sp. 164]MCK1668700.1 hypothetical protein [Bradyrhizobium sp. 153]MCK1756359.1 hypothetical protein [Bradyrhizobium sp. 137]
MVIEGLAGRLGKLEFDGTTGLLLADTGSIGRIAAGCDIIDFEGDNVATTKFAIDSDVEQRQIANPTFDLELCSNGPDVLGTEWRLRANDLSLIPRSPLGDVHVGAWDISHDDLLS